MHTYNDTIKTEPLALSSLSHCRILPRRSSEIKKRKEKKNSRNKEIKKEKIKVHL